MNTSRLNFSSGGVHEVAAKIRDGVFVAGHFDNPDAANSAIAALPDYIAVWSTLNPLATLPDSRALNPARLTRGSRAGARHIKKRTSLMLDFDPPRPEADTMSTDEEHEAGLTQARECRTWLHSLGWPLLPLCDSGSGAHLRPTVDMDTSEETKQLLSRLLQAIHRRYHFADAGTFDTPRLCRYYGTWNRKSAENSPERPWRLSRVLDSGDAGLVTRGQIADVISRIGLPVIRQYSGTEKPDPAAVDRTVRQLAEWLDKIGATLTAIVPLSDGRTLLRLSHCPLDRTHVGSSAGIGISVGGNPQNFCRHTGSCGTMHWSEWRTAVEKKYGLSMQLGSRLIFSKRGKN